VYYAAKKLALSNGQEYHVGAILLRGRRVIKIGVNSFKTHPRFKRRYPDGSCAAHMHAEMSVLRYAQPGDEIQVIRWRKDGSKGMAKPCKYCQEFITHAGISRVSYTNDKGKWETLVYG